MDFRTLVLVAAFMAFPTACLIYAWQKRSEFRPLIAWREKLLQIALPFATLSLLLTSVFLAREWRWDGQSFADNPPQYWVVLNRINLLCGIIVCGVTLLGKGKLRLPLSLWCVSLPFLAYLVFMMGFSY